MIFNKISIFKTYNKQDLYYDYEIRISKKLTKIKKILLTFSLKI